jgi:hypothetical protein
VRKRWLAVGVGAVVVFGAFCAHVLLVLRRCDEVRDLPRGSFDYRLCGLGDTLVASVTVVAPVSEPLYTRVLADGLSVGYSVLKYESLEPPAKVHAAMADFLRQKGFTEGVADADYEWWTDQRTRLGLAIRNVQKGSLLEVLHDTGND